jgi:hypothetical protein
LAHHGLEPAAVEYPGPVASAWIDDPASVWSEPSRCDAEEIWYRMSLILRGLQPARMACALHLSPLSHGTNHLLEVVSLLLIREAFEAT